MFIKGVDVGHRRCHIAVRLLGGALCFGGCLGIKRSEAVKALTDGQCNFGGIILAEDLYDGKEQCPVFNYALKSGLQL
jgi:hypothetical protein